MTQPNGADFELNLSKAHVDELRQTLAPYIKAARKTMAKKTASAVGSVQFI
jgi:Lsr2